MRSVCAGARSCHRGRPQRAKQAILAGLIYRGLCGTPDPSYCGGKIHCSILSAAQRYNSQIDISWMHPRRFGRHPTTSLRLFLEPRGLEWISNSSN